jgi:hypothetical protein
MDCNSKDEWSYGGWCNMQKQTEEKMENTERNKIAIPTTTTTVIIITIK